MNDKLKQNLDEISSDFLRMRTSNTPTYWMTLIIAGIAITGLIALILKTTGIILLVTATFVYMFNNLLNSWVKKRNAEKKAEELSRQVKVAKKTPQPVVVETYKEKQVRINPKG